MRGISPSRKYSIGSHMPAFLHSGLPKALYTVAASFLLPLPSLLLLLLFLPFSLSLLTHSRGLYVVTKLINYGTGKRPSVASLLICSDINKLLHCTAIAPPGD
ncbi:hypothetical protein DER45DRAFT_243346 [Fusarium avenaceum]|nr:hypothetical protein DER45DRAFT_243346 [Fusarium avenaceum]